MGSIDLDNWTFTHFYQGVWRAQVTFGADPDASELYFVTLMDQDFNTIYQRTFKELAPALSDINQRYGHWQFKSGEAPSEGGCGSCQAH